MDISKSLKKLSLMQNGIADEGIMYIAKSIGINKSLIDLNLGCFIIILGLNKIEGSINSRTR